MMSDTIFIKNIGIQGAGIVEDDLHYYTGFIQSNSLNTAYFFKLSHESLKSIAKQANRGVPIYANHRSYGPPIGKSIAAHLVSEKDIERVQSTFFIKDGLADVNSSDHIQRLDTGIVSELSTGFMLTEDSRLVCDICNEEMTQKYEWFYAYFEDENGHKLGEKIKQKGKKDQRVTAMLQGAVNLLEYSIVASGADPDTEILEKLQNDINTGIFDTEALAYFAEAQNFETQHFLNSLHSETFKPTSIHNGGSPMSIELLTQENERLVAENERLTAELETLQSNSTAHEDYESMQSELQAKLTAAENLANAEKARADKNEAMANEGDIAIKAARADYKTAFISSCGNSPPTETELEQLDQSLSAINSYTELKAGIDRLRGEARRNRAGGRQSHPTPPSQQEPQRELNWHTV